MGFSEAMKAAGETLKEIKADQAKKSQERAAHRAHMARIRAIQQAKADESKKTVLEAIAEHNAEYGQYARIILWEERPTPKCGSWTLVEDCKDSNCFRHYDEKKAIRAKRAEQAATRPGANVEALFGFSTE